MTSPAHDTPADSIASMEPVLAPAAESERFERAGAISDRLVDNIETVVYVVRAPIDDFDPVGLLVEEKVPGVANGVLARSSGTFSFHGEQEVPSGGTTAC